MFKKWEAEKDTLKRAEILAEITVLLKSNTKLRQLKWLNSQYLCRLNEITVKTKQNLTEELKSSLNLLNGTNFWKKGVIRAS